MSREAISRSISFDPAMFDLVEETRQKYGMERSEFVVRCILHGLAATDQNPASLVAPIPEGLRNKLTTHSSRTAEALKGKRKAKKP